MRSTDHVPSNATQGNPMGRPQTSAGSSKRRLPRECSILTQSQKVLVTKARWDSAARRHSGPSPQAKKLSLKSVKCLFYITALLWIYSFSEKRLIWRQREELQQVRIHQFSGTSAAFMYVLTNRPFAQLSTIYAVHVKGLHLKKRANKTRLLKFRETWISIVTTSSKN